MKGRTHNEYVGDGYSVRIVYCADCGTYLGVNYPSERCTDCKSVQ